MKKLPPFQQLVSVTPLHYSSFIKHYNLIKVHSGKQFVHNSYDSVVPELFSNYSLDELLCGLIDTGGFIYYYYSLFGEENTSKTDQVHLSRA